jgi:molybdopterin-guanine dinucleotide biosynthesis protein B
MRMFAVVGRSGSGKTTLVERLVAYYSSRGLRVATMKSMLRDFEMDRPGKDSYRHKLAGARASSISNGRTFALVADIEHGESPVELARRFFSGYDLVIIEGYKDGAFYKIEVVGDSPEAPLFLDEGGGIGILVSDLALETSLPFYKRDDLEGITGALERLFFTVTPGV